MNESMCEYFEIKTIIIDVSTYLPNLCKLYLFRVNAFLLVVEPQTSKKLPLKLTALLGNLASDGLSMRL